MNQEANQIKISSDLTFFRKRLAPGILYFVALFFMIIYIIPNTWEVKYNFLYDFLYNYQFYIFILCMLSINPLFKTLVDCVYDCGDHLIVKNGQYEIKIDFTQISTLGLYPAKITYLSEHGQECVVSFLPKLRRRFFFKKHSWLADLRKRINEAKNLTEQK